MLQVFEHPTAAEISEYLCSELMVALEHNAPEAEVVSTMQVVSAVPILSTGVQEVHVGLVGMSCKLAGGASTPHQLWTSLVLMSSHITHSPPQRWHNACSGVNAPTALLSGAFLGNELHSVLAMEYGGFSTAEAKQADMHIQLLLDTSVEALTDGGWSSSDVKSARFGVFTASQPSDS